MIERLIEELRKKVEEARGDFRLKLGGVGITSLLQCPLKHEYKRKYPELLLKTAEMDEGLLFELAMKKVLRSLYGSRFREEFPLVYEVDGFLIEGYLDAVIEEEERAIGLEFKSVKKLKVETDLPPEELDVINVEEKDVKVSVPEHYLLQARIEKFLLEKTLQKPATVYLLMKALLVPHNKKAYVQFPVKDPVSEEELKELVRRFREEKRPRYEWECRYCSFRSVCTIKAWS